jgi:hypothetical protein
MIDADVRALITSLIAGAGTVTSVGMSMPAIFSVSGSPVTTTGTLAATLANQSANRVWAGPTSGGAAAPTFRALVAADIPSLSSVYQPRDADLDTWATLTPSANAQSLVTAANYSAMRTLLSLVPGTDVQAYDSDLTTIAGLTPTTDNFIVSVASAWASRTPAQVKTTLSLNNVDNTSDATKNAAVAALTNKDLTSGTNTFPTFNQNTTGSAAKWTTARNLAGNSVDGSANVAFANKFIVQGTADAGLSAAQFLGALGTGIVKNTTTTGVLSIAVAGDFPTLNQNTTGSAATLTTPRAIYGNNFDGSAALAQIIASTYGGTGNGFTKFSGPATSEKTFTLPNSNATLLYSGGALGTPSSGDLTNATNLPVASGISGLGANVATFLATPSSANLASAITDETGSGSLVFATTPTIVSPTLTNVTIMEYDGLGTTMNPAAYILNGTAAAAGAQQISPAVYWEGQGWKTNATAGSQSVQFTAHVLPIQGAANPTGKWILSKDVNATGTKTEVLSVDTSGNIIATGTLAASNFSGSSSGANTGDQTNIIGNAATATALQNARTIGGVSFNGTANITVASATGGFTISGGDLALGANNLTMTGSLGATGARLTKGWFTDLQVTNAIAGSITGNAATVTTNANLTGDVTSSGNATTIGANKVTLGMLATLAANSVIGNSTGSTATPTAVSMLTTATASSVALRDANANLSVANILEGYTTTATAAGTTVLTVSSNSDQYFTGSSTQTVTLPVAATLVNGQSWWLTNISTGVVTVNTSGGNLLATMPARTQAIVQCVNTAGGTGTASWSVTFIGDWTATARNAPTVPYLSISMPADTAIATTTESIGVNFAAGTRTWVDGTTILQREHVFAAPTYNKTTTSATFTTAVNVDIADPVAGSGVTITNNYGLRAANVLFTGVIKAGSTPTTLTDSAGKILSAALNTVGIAQGGTNAASFGTTNGIDYFDGTKLTNNANVTWTTPYVQVAGLTNAGFAAFASNSTSSQFVLGNAALTKHWAMYETEGASGQQGSFKILDYVAVVDKLEITTTGNVILGGSTATRATTQPTNAIVIPNGTAPVGARTNAVDLYATAGELRVMDAGGTATLLSPHDEDNYWIYDSEDTMTGETLRIDVEKLLRFVNDHFGLDFVKGNMIRKRTDKFGANTN